MTLELLCDFLNFSTLSIWAEGSLNVNWVVHDTHRYPQKMTNDIKNPPKIIKVRRSTIDQRKQPQRRQWVGDNGFVATTRIIGVFNHHDVKLDSRMSMMMPDSGGSRTVIVDDGMIEPSIYDMKAPLLSKDETNTVATSIISDSRGNASTRESVTPKPTQSQLVNLVVIGLVTTAGVAASLSAIILVPAAMTIAAGCICFLNSPIVMYKAKKLLVLPLLKKEVDELQHTKKLLKRDMKKLKEEVKSLDAQKRR